MKVIQLCGTNGVGKTTCVLQFVENNNFVSRTISIGKKDIDYHWNEEKRQFVLGRYGTKKCGGIDGVITNRDFLQYVIKHILQTIRPSLFVFEGLVYGTTYKFRREIDNICKSLGYEYLALILSPPLDIAISRTIARNQNENIDVMRLQQKYYLSISSSNKLIISNVNVKFVDTSRIDKNLMGEIIKENI